MNFMFAHSAQQKCNSRKCGNVTRDGDAATAAGKGRRRYRGSDKIHPHNVTSNIDYMRNVLDIVMNKRDLIMYSNDPRNCDRIIYLGSPLHFMELDATRDKLRASMKRGYEAVKRFLRYRERISTRCSEREYE